MRRFLAIILILAGVTNVSAQSAVCGFGLPCGNIPWTLPQYPVLASPTPFPTSAITATPAASATPTGAATATPTATPTATVDIGGIESGLSELDNLLTATAQGIYNLDGTPVAVGTVAYGEYESNAALALSYVKAVGAADFGVVTPLMQFLIGSFLFMLTVKLLEISIPFVGLLFGALRKAVQVVLDFIPF